MYYRLTDDYTLHSFLYRNYYLYHRSKPEPAQINEKDFMLLLDCDSKHDLNESEALHVLTDKGIIEPCGKGEASSGRVFHQHHEHRYVQAINLMVTGKCNYNCLHCFNASDNADRMEEWELKDLVRLFEEAASCGIHSVTLTGGEPMLHPHFREIVQEIKRNGLVLEKLTTNGFFINEDILDMFLEMGISPQIKISFDGIYHHDYMRGHKGAIESTLSAFRLCKKKGFDTFAQTQVFKDNLPTMKDTLCLLEDAGVKTMRIIRTTPTPRWAMNQPEGSLSFDEYFEAMMDLAKWYMGTRHEADLIMWRFLVLSSKRGTYHMINVTQKDGIYRPASSVCLGSRMMMAITCEGDVIPCMQLGGILSDLGVKFDSLKERCLTDIIKEGRWLDAVCRNRYWLRENNRKCDECEWFGYCGGGCRALGILDSDVRKGIYESSASDPLACVFFKNGWFERIKEEFKDYEEV